MGARGSLAAVSSCVTKTRYETQEEAERVRQIREREGGLPLKVYGCWCGGWHLTKRIHGRRGG